MTTAELLRRMEGATSSEILALMAEENVEIVRAGFERFPSPAFDVLAPDIEWQVRPDLPDAAIYRGHEEVRQLIARFDEVLDEIWVRPEEFIQVGEDTVIVPLRWGGKGKGSGIEVEERGGETWIFTVQEGRLVRVNEFATREEALEAAGVRD
jgi:ketosteroid isomerase-like protein